MKSLLIISLLFSLAVFPVAGCGEEEAVDTVETVEEIVTKPNTLLSIKIDETPVLDARNPDQAWNDAPELKVRLANGDNFQNGETDMTLKSLYNGDAIYFMAQWTDPTESLERTPWIKQADGTWEKAPASAKYEDKMAFIWNINDSIKDFNTQGCAVACHAGEGVPEGGDFGKKYTSSQGEVGDIWHWKVARTDSLDMSTAIGAFIDDQALDSTPYNPDIRDGDAGRYSDPGTGAYSNNETDDKASPEYQWQNIPENPREKNFLLDDNKSSLVDSDWTAGDMLPGVLVRNASGDRADIMVSSNYSNGTWTIVFKRDLVTGSTAEPPVDVQFNDLERTYYFGVAAFDNAQVRHAYVSSALMLEFSR